MLTHLIYASKKVESLALLDVMDIVRKSETRNRQSDITGFLCFSEKYFLQVLEGNRARINETFRRIVADQRHTGVEIISAKEIEAREFGRWSMGFMSHTEDKRKIYLRYSKSDLFDPYDLTESSAFGLLKSVSAASNSSVEKTG